MEIFSDILTVLRNQWQIAGGIALFFCLGAIPIYLLLVFSLRKHLRTTEYFVVSLAGSPSVLLVFFFAISLIKFPVVVISISFLWLPAALLALLFILLVFKHEPVGWFGLILFIVSLLLRLPFLTRVLVPSYFDSAEHYRLVKALLQVYQGASWESIFRGLTSGYYHMGFHLLAAGMSFILQADPLKVILLLGQFILVLIPLPVFFLVQRMSKDNLAALFGTLLAAFGWYMPAFAVNWGKYPALSALLPFGFVLSLMYIGAESSLSRVALRRVGWMLIAGALTAILTHSRTLILLVFSVLAWSLAGFALRRERFIGASLMLVMLAFLGKQVWSTSLLRPALEPYLSGQIGWGTLIVAGLLPFALQQFPRQTLFNLLFIILLLSALFIPLGNLIPSQECQTLLDRPFVEMSLFFPLALQGGIGLAGLSKVLQQGLGTVKTFRYAIPITIALFFGAATLPAVFHNDLYLYPSSCCILMRDNDVFALDWLKRNLPPASRIAIASAPLMVVSQDCPTEWIGSDAGLWIPLLTDKTTYSLPYDTDFRSKAVFERLCRSGSLYVYIGGANQSFRAEFLAEKNDWYELLLSIPNVRIYRLKCEIF